MAKSPINLEEVPEVGCLRIMLRPLIRFALRGNLSLMDFIRISKVVFVEVGEEELKKVTKKINVSRLCVLTGVHRKDLDEIYRKKRTPTTYSVSIPARVLGEWEQNRRYRTSAGKPRVLSFEGEKSEFKDLVESLSTNLNPGTVLFELERLGSVVRTAQGLKLVKSVGKFDGKSEKALELVSRDVESLIGSAIENISTPKPVLNLHIRTEYDNVLVDKIPKIREWILKEGRAFHKKMRDYISTYDRDINPGGGKGDGGARVTVGAFSVTSWPEVNKEE